MLVLLTGTDWKANRAKILDMISRDVKQGQGGRILIVPELISHDTERRLCATAGDTASRFAEVLSFTRLARRVSDDVGHAAEECLDNGGRVVAMASAARQLHSVLKAYASVETRPEFLEGLVDAVDEFKRCCITSNDLFAAAKKAEGTLAQKLEELAMLYDAYDGLCLRGKRDPRDQMTWLLEQLHDSSFAEEHVFYIDGFPDFTRQHMEILEYLIQVSPAVIVSMNCDCIGSRAMAFEKAGETAKAILTAARRLGVEVVQETVHPLDTPVSIVSQLVFQGKIEIHLPMNVLSVCRTDTIGQECILAAERVLELVQSGARYRQIGIVCPNVDNYKNTLDMIFRRCGIPIYISGTDDILEKSVITTVLAAMDAALGGFDKREVIRYLKSMLSPLELDISDKLENYAILWNINGSKWLAQWKNHPRGLGEEFSDEDTALLEEMNRARMLALEPLARLREGFRTANNLREQVYALYRFLEDISLSQQLSDLAEQLDAEGDNRSAQILNQLWEILLTALEQLHDVLGNTVWDTDSFTRLIKLLLSQYDVGTIPPVLDSVTAGSVSAMRCQQVEHLIVMGALEGDLPGYGGSTGILNDQEREDLRRLGVQLTGGSLDGLKNEFSEIYGVFCSAEKSIMVSCPAGQPSFLYRRLCALSEEECHPDIFLGAALADKEEAVAFLTRWHAVEAVDALGLGEIYGKIRRRGAHSLGEISSKNISGLYGSSLHLSASQIDRQAECRLSYFLKYGMRAKERKPATIDPAEFGTFVHAVLENTVREVMDTGGFRAVSLEDTISVAEKHSEDYAAERFADLDTERIQYLFQRNRQELNMIVEELWEELHNCDFLPAKFELAFGNGGELPAIPIPGKKMNAQLSGFVDRVDVWNNGGSTYYRVVDYKTGKKDFD